MNESLKKRLLVLACVAYVVCPLDFDFIPIIGWIDDAAVIVMTYQELRAMGRRKVVKPPTITIDHAA